MLRHNAEHHHDERPSRTTHLRARPAQERRNEARDDGGVNPSFGPKATGDRKSHGKGQRHKADSHTRDEVGKTCGPVVVTPD